MRPAKTDPVGAPVPLIGASIPGLVIAWCIPVRQTSPQHGLIISYANIALAPPPRRGFLSKHMQKID